MSTEEKLKQYILDNYKSLRDFSIKCDIPYTTVISIINRGIDRAGINTVKSICECLKIDINALARGNVVASHNIEHMREEFITQYNSLNETGRRRVDLYLEDLIASDRFTKEDEDE